MNKAELKNRDVLVGNNGHARVLVVDEEPVSSLVIRRFLEIEGIPNDFATSVDEAVHLYQRNRYRLVICDWKLRGQSGLELCNQLRADDFNYVYFILCSDQERRGDLKDAFEAGIDDFLPKPLDLESLHQRLKVARRILNIEHSLQTQRLEMEHRGEALNAMNHSLMHASRRFEELFNGLPVACFTIDETGHIHEWNRQCEQDFQIKNEDAFQQPVWDVFSAETRLFWTPNRVAAIFSGESLVDEDWTLELQTGEIRHFVGNAFGLKDLSGNLVGAICANLDISDRKAAEKRIDEQMDTINLYAKELQQQKTQLERANTKLEHLALTDGMTGLLNHRGFQEELERAYERHIRINLPLSMILMDVDHFKQFNDTYGHQGGDSVLQKFGQMLQRTTRKHEPAARYGGEEFAIILEGADPEAAIQAGERFREAIHKRTWPHRQITASFGVATVFGAEFAKEELIKRADLALYESKRSGRDCVTHFSSMADVKVN